MTGLCKLEGIDLALNCPCPAQPQCYRGTIDNYNYQHKDGPCDAADCKWPKDLKPRPHFTDNPNRLVYEGDGAWRWVWPR